MRKKLDEMPTDRLIQQKILPPAVSFTKVIYQRKDGTPLVAGKEELDPTNSQINNWSCKKHV